MKTDDIVYFDDNRGVVISVWPSRRKYGPAVEVMVYWPETGNRTVEWQSDLLTEAEYLEWDQ